MRARRWLIGTFTAVVVLVGGALIVTQTDWFRRRALGLVVSQLTPYVDGHVTIGSLEGNVLTHVRLKNVAIARGDRAIVRVGQIDLTYRPIALLYHSVAVSRLVFSDVEVAAAETNDGWDLASLIKPQPEDTTPSRPWPVSIDHVQLIDGAAVLTRRQGSPLHVALNLAGSALLGADGTHISVQSLRASESTTGAAIDDGSLAVSARSAAIDLTAALSLHGATIRASAHLDTTSQTSRAFVSLRHANLQRLPPVFGAPNLESLAGADIDVTVTGGDWTADARLEDSRIASARIARGSVAHIASRDGRLSYTANGHIAQLNAREFSALIDVTGIPSTGITADVAARGSGTERDQMQVTVDARFADSAIGAARITSGTVVGADIRGNAVTYRARGGVRRLNLADFAVWTGSPRDLPTHINGAFSANGRLQMADAAHPHRTTDTLVMHANVVLDPSTVADTKISRLTATVGLDGHHANGTIATSFTGLDERALRSGTETPLSLNGSINATFDVVDYSADDILDGLSGQVQAALASSTVKGVTIQSASLDTSIASGLATVRQLSARTDGATIDASGSVALGDTGTSHLTYTADVIDASRFNALIGADVTGAGRIEGTMTGTRQQAHMSGTVSTHSVAYATTASALTLDGTFDVAMPDLDPTRLDATGKANATFIKAANTDLERAAVTFRYRQGLIDIDGTLDQKDRSLSIEGSLSTMAEGSEVLLRRLAMSTSGLTWTTVPGTASTLRVTPSVISVDHVELVSGPQKLIAEGGIARTAGAAVQKPLTVHGSRIDISDAMKLALSTLPLDGTLDFAAAVSGTVDSPKATGQLTVVNGKSGDAVFEKLSGDVSLDAPTITLDLLLQQSAAASLAAKGSIPSSLAFGPDAGVPMNVAVKSNGIDLGLIEGLTTELEKVTGTAALDLHIAGTAAVPDITGRATIVDGAFHVTSTGVTYQHLNAGLSLGGQRATIDQFSIQDSDAHTLTVTGAGDLVGGAAGRSFAFTATSADIHVLDNELGNVSVTANVNASKGASGAKVGGSLRVSRGRLELDALLPRFTSNAYATERKLSDEEAKAAAAKAAGNAPAPSMYDTADINIRVDLPDNLVVRGRDLRQASSATNLGDINVTLGGGLQIHKTPGGEPTLTGTLQAVRGHYQFQGRRFDVERGSSLRFVGGAPMDALLDLSATREISGVTARVEVRGTVDRPAIEISSTPALDEGDVLSLIVFNQPMNELGSSEKVTLGQRAGALAAGTIASPLAASVARALNLDMVEITAPEANGQGAGVTLGQQLSDRIYLNFRQQFGRGDIGQLSFEYRFNEAMRIITSVAEQSESTRGSRAGRRTGIDFVYFIRY